MRIGAEVAGVENGPEVAKFGLNDAFGAAMDAVLMLQAVADEFGDGNHLQAVKQAELAELRHAGHGAILIHDFADDAGGVESGEAGEVDGGFGLAGADEHAAFAGAEGEDVAGAGEVVRAGFGIDGGEDGVGAVGGGDAGGDAFAGIDGLAEGGAEIRRVVGRHQGEAQGVAALRSEGEADESAAVGGHEIDDFGRDFFRGDGEVAFVFPVLIVDDDEHAAGADLLDGLRY